MRHENAYSGAPSPRVASDARPGCARAVRGPGAESRAEPSRCETAPRHSVWSPGGAPRAPVEAAIFAGEVRTVGPASTPQYTEVTNKVGIAYRSVCVCVMHCNRRTRAYRLMATCQICSCMNGSFMNTLRGMSGVKQVVA